MTSLAVAGLVGRADELSMLQTALGRLIAGRGGVVWITGEPGIGKSSLAGALAAGATRAGCVVHAGVGDESKQSFPLRLMADCLDIAIDSDDVGVVEIAHLLHGDVAAPVVADPVNAAAERMLAVVDRLCATRPVILIAEDLHWADPPSLGLWSRLARSIDQIPLLLVGSCRTVPARPALQRLSVAVQELGGALIELGPLSQPDTIAAARYALGAQPGPRLTAELARTGGNPLYIRELIDALRLDGSIRIADGHAELPGAVDKVPESLVATISRQLTFLSEPTRRGLRRAAVLGPEFGVAEWALSLGESAIQLSDVVQEALTAGVIAVGEPRLSFRHDLIRQVLLEQTPAADRQEIHRHVARSLAVSGYGADVIARHLLATSVLDDWTLTWLTEASQSVLQVAAEPYETLLEHACSMLTDSNDQRWEALASRLAYTQFWLGHDEAAEQTATTVLRRTTDKELAGLMSVQAVRAASRQYHFEDALALAEDTLADPAIPKLWHARLRAWTAHALFCLERAELAAVTATEALQRAQECDDQLGALYARRVLALTDRDRGRALIDTILGSLGDDDESADLRLLLVRDYVNVAWQEGVADDVEAVVTRALVLGEQLGAARTDDILFYAAVTQLGRGNWDEALRYVDMASTETADGRRAKAVAAQIMLRRGQRERADAHLRAAAGPDHRGGVNLAQTRDTMLRHALFCRAEIDGDLATALALGRPHLDGAFAVYTPLVVRVALELDEIETAKAAAAWASNSVHVRPSDVEACNALLDDDVDTLLRLAEQYHQRGWRLYSAFAMEEAAVRLGSAGETERARAALTDVVQLYADFGATMDIRRVDGRLRRYGVRRGPRTLRHRPTHGWEALTPSELRIATLVAEGLSNPDIAALLYVSRGTVQTHVSSILSKLRMTSRVELIRHYLAQKGR